MPNNAESIQTMLQELGPNVPDIDAILQSDDVSWAIQFSDETVIGLDWAEDPPRLMFSAALGRPAEDRRMLVYQQLLEHGMRWREIGGARGALGGPEGDAMLLQESSADQIYDVQLRKLVLDFADQARNWSAFVSSADAAALVPAYPTANS